jgi:UV DNA damage endonuclease
LYRLSSSLFPHSEEGVGREVLVDMTHELGRVGLRAAELNVRVVLHPDQFVVLSSEQPSVIANSVAILQHHAFVLDHFGLPRSPWTAMTIHGGKRRRAATLIATIQRLPDAVRTRLTFENDERAYGAGDILAICRETGVPMVFDAHHHVCHAGLTTYEDPSVLDHLIAARVTWPEPVWQLVHLSNGREYFADPRHSDYITQVPSSYYSVGWIEVEAKAKEAAIAQLRERWPWDARPLNS